jgi:hypothetical protein
MPACKSWDEAGWMCWILPVIWALSVATASLTSGQQHDAFFWLAGYLLLFSPPPEVVKMRPRVGILSAENMYGRLHFFCRFSTCEKLKFEPP